MSAQSAQPALTIRLHDANVRARSKGEIMIRRTIGLASLATTIARGASAQTPTCVGTWASNPLQCLIDQSLQAAPLILARNGYDQHEAQCKFTSVTRTLPIRGACAPAAVKGDQQRTTFTLKVSGNTLTLFEGRGALTMMMCG
jgi:hypothetical protein